MTEKKQKWETAKSRDEAWAWAIPKYRDPITNKVIPQDQGDAKPVGTQKNEGNLK